MRTHNICFYIRNFFCLNTPLSRAMINVLLISFRKFFFFFFFFPFFFSFFSFFFFFFFCLALYTEEVFASICHDLIQN